jgi:hypothetical protein
MPGHCCPAYSLTALPRAYCGVCRCPPLRVNSFVSANIVHEVLHVSEGEARSIASAIHSAPGILKDFAAFQALLPGQNCEKLKKQLSFE